MYLFTAVRGQVEREHRQEGDAHARDDEVHGVEERLPAHLDVEGDVEVGLVAARVELLVANRGHLQDVPLDRHVELGQVDAQGDHVGVLHLAHVSQVNLERREFLNQVAGVKINSIAAYMLQQLSLLGFWNELNLRAPIRLGLILEIASVFFNNEEAYREQIWQNWIGKPIKLLFRARLLLLLFLTTKTKLGLPIRFSPLISSFEPSPQQYQLRFQDTQILQQQQLLLVNLLDVGGDGSKKSNYLALLGIAAPKLSLLLLLYYFI